jgi:hypothetical protein
MTNSKLRVEAEDSILTTRLSLLSSQLCSIYHYLELYSLSTDVNVYKYAPPWKSVKVCASLEISEVTGTITHIRIS